MTCCSTALREEMKTRWPPGYGLSGSRYSRWVQALIDPCIHHFLWVWPINMQNISVWVCLVFHEYVYVSALLGWITNQFCPLFFFSLYFQSVGGQETLSLQVPAILAASNEGRTSIRWSCVHTHTHTGLRGMRITTYSVCLYAYIECTHSHTHMYIYTQFMGWADPV